MRRGLSLLLLFVICVPAIAQHASDQERNKQIARSFFEECSTQETPGFLVPYLLALITCLK